MSDERHFRESARPQLGCRVVIHRAPSHNSIATTCYTHDISTGGLFAITDEAFPIGEVVDIALYTPSTWEPLELRAEVCWHRWSEEDEPSGVGVRFRDVSHEAASALARLVASLDFQS